LLSLRFSFSLLAALLFAGSGSAVTYTYNMTGSSMSMTNQLCTPATCNVAVTGSMTIDDDGAGNVSITSLSLSHVGYEVASPSLLSVVLERTSITLGAGSVAASPGGSTTLSAVFGGTTLNQTGTVTCTNGAFNCTLAGYPGPGVFPLPPTEAPPSLGTWTFDAFHNLFAASFVYESQTTPQAASETLFLQGSVIPEPGTGLLVGAGLVGMAALRRRARA